VTSHGGRPRWPKDRLRHGSLSSQQPAPAVRLQMFALVSMLPGERSASAGSRKGTLGRAPRSRGRRPSAQNSNAGRRWCRRGGSRPGIEASRRFPLHRFVHDRVPAIDRLRFMPDERHGDGPRGARALERPHGGPAQVMPNAPGPPPALQAFFHVARKWTMRSPSSFVIDPACRRVSLGMGNGRRRPTARREQDVHMQSQVCTAATSSSGR